MVTPDHFQNQAPQRSYGSKWSHGLFWVICAFLIKVISNGMRPVSFHPVTARLPTLPRLPMASGRYLAILAVLAAFLGIQSIKHTTHNSIRPFRKPPFTPQTVKSICRFTHGIVRQQRQRPVAAPAQHTPVRLEEWREQIGHGGVVADVAFLPLTERRGTPRAAWRVSRRRSASRHASTSARFNPWPRCGLIAWAASPIRMTRSS